MINNFTIITSSIDQASLTMKNHLVNNEDFKIIENRETTDFSIKSDNSIYYELYRSVNYPNINLLFTDQNLIQLNTVGEIIPNDHFIIFLSKHASKSKTPTLTSHFTGNFSNDTHLGGKPYEIGTAYPSFQKSYMNKLFERKDELSKYDLIIESTHHGPTSPENPILFVEIGSSETEWNSELTASIVCKCLLDVIYKNGENTNEKKCIKTAIGIGGNHYPKKFNDLILFSNVAFGAIASKYNLTFVNESMIKQMKRKSIEKINFIYLDEKGLGKEKTRILEMLRDQESEIILV